MKTRRELIEKGNLERLAKCYQREHLFSMTNTVLSSLATTSGALALLNYSNTNSSTSLKFALGSLFFTGIVNLSRLAYEIVHGSYYQGGILEGWNKRRELNFDKDYREEK